MTEKEEYYHLTEQFEPVSNMLFASQGNGSYLTVIGAVNTLNTLRYANEQLDKENQQLDEKVCALTMDLVTTKSYKQLEKENERLKSENDKFRSFIRRNHAIGMIHRILTGDGE